MLSNYESLTLTYFLFVKIIIANVAIADLLELRKKKQFCGDHDISGPDYPK